MNNTELELEDDDDTRAVILLENFHLSSEVSMSHNQFSNPDAVRELSVNMKLPSVLDLGLNFWNQSNYSSVIQRYVAQHLDIYLRDISQ